MDNKNPLPFKKTKPGTIIKWVIILIIFIFVTNPALIPFLPKDVKASLSDTWKRVFGDVQSIGSSMKFNWNSLFSVIAVIIIMALFTNLASFIIEKIKPKTGKGLSTQTLVRSLIRYISPIVTVIWCLSAVGIDISALIAGVGILTLAVSFGAQSLIEDVVTGIFLVFENQFSVGDYIEVDGFRGTVTSIGIRVTTIKGPGDNYKIMNNSDIRNILNRSKETSIATTLVSVAYHEDIENVEEVLKASFKDMFEKYPEVFLEEPTNLGVEQLAESGVTFRLAARIHEKDLFNAPRIMNREVKIAFDKAGIEIPFPQVVVHDADADK